MRIALALTMVLATGAPAGTVIYVDDDAPPGGDGTSWETAHRFLQEALAIAAVPSIGGTEIRIAHGVYKPDHDEGSPAGSGDAGASFVLLDGVSIYGGYAGMGAADPDARDVTLYETVLSGDLADNDDGDFAGDTFMDNSHQVAIGDAAGLDTVLDGVTITGGSAGPDWYDPGGGLCCQGGAPTVRDCTFVNNGALVLGGGILCMQSTAVVIDCIFINNGRGIHNFGADVTVNSCLCFGNWTAIYSEEDGATTVTCSTFEDDHGLAMQVGSGSSATVSGCLFQNNRAPLWAADTDIADSIFRNNGLLGAVRLTGECSVTDCVFEANTQADDSFMGGGALSLYDATATVAGCTFTDNVAIDSSGFTDGGGAIASSGAVIVTNCTFTGNAAVVGESGPYGGAIQASGSIEIAGCRFKSNQARYGGAVAIMYCNPASIVECVFEGNETIEPGSGSGLYNNNSATTVTGCTFAANSGNGGAINNNVDGDLTVSGSDFVANSSPGSGGAMFSADPVTVSDCDFVGNTAYSAGAVRSPGSFDNCRFIENVATGDSASGGAVRYADVLTDCVFAGNRVEGAAAAGGAVHNGGTFVNCLFDGNAVDTAMSGDPDAGGAAIYNDYANQAFLYNCTFSGNAVDDPGLGISVHNHGGSSAALVNCIVWDDGPNPIVDLEGSSTTVSFSDVRDGWTGAGGDNIDADPLFADAAAGDLRPGSGSPCIDAGSNAGVPEGTATDLDGAPRIVDDPCSGVAGAVVDMGVYEFQGSSVSAGDLDGDCDVDVDDFLMLLAAWGPCPPGPGCPGDLDGDGIVGINDLLLLLANWTA